VSERRSLRDRLYTATMYLSTTGLGLASVNSQG
jgi:hypothetical protein